MKKLLIYFNLGTPASPKTKDVRPYLREFLSDPLVIDIPAPLRWALVNLIIAPFRAPKSAEAYQSIWTEKGSPLMVNTKSLCDKLKANRPPGHSLDTSSNNLSANEQWDVVWCMRYGSPSAREALSEISLSDYEEVYLFPAYPQYALSSSETGFMDVKKILKELGYKGQVKELLSYHKEPPFVDAVARSVQSFWAKNKYDHILFSYHGLPKRHVKKVSAVCFKDPNCCAVERPENALCYRHQCSVLTELLAKRLNLSKNQYSLGFQSRLGKNWIEPFTDVLIEKLPSQGVKRLLVACPSFTADCLETLEEINMRGRESFIEKGGQEFDMVPAVNDSDEWVEGLWSIVQNEQVWKPARPYLDGFY